MVLHFIEKVSKGDVARPVSETHIPNVLHELVIMG
jgi:hypothetical protein